MISVSPAARRLLCWEQQRLATYLEVWGALEFELGRPPTIDDYVSWSPNQGDDAAWRALFETTPIAQLEKMISIALLPGTVVTPLEQMYLFLLAASGEQVWARIEEPCILRLYEARIRLPDLAQRIAVSRILRLAPSGHWQICYIPSGDACEQSIEIMIYAQHDGQSDEAYVAYAYRCMTELVMGVASTGDSLQGYNGLKIGNS